MEMFNSLMSSIRERIENLEGRFLGFGIDNFRTSLENLWRNGMKDQAITLLICYHYSSKDTTVVKTPGGTVYLIRNGIDFLEISELIGLSKSDMKFDGLTISFERFTRMLNKNDVSKKKKMLNKIKIQIPNGRIDRDELIMVYLLYRYSRNNNLRVEVTKNQWIYVNSGSSINTILEKRGIV